MKIAITGATGFVGRNLIKYLHEHNQHEILQIGRTSGSPGEDFIRIDDFLGSAATYDAMIHLAGKAHDLKYTSATDEYFKVNYELTCKVFEHFKTSSAAVLIYVSSVKAVADIPSGVLTEDTTPSPGTPYGESKLKAENYLLSAELPSWKKVYILRPCMIHGPGNKGNLNSLITLVRKNIPYPLGAFDNRRSFLSVGNFCFIVHQLLSARLPGAVYNLSDNESISTNELISIISNTLNKPVRIWKLNKQLIKMLAKMGDVLHLPINSENLKKLTTDYVVANDKIISALGTSLPYSSREGLIETLKAIK